MKLRNRNRDSKMNTDSKISPSKPSTSKATCYNFKSPPQPRKPPVRKNKNISEVNTDSKILPSKPSTSKAKCYKLKSPPQRPRKPPVRKNENISEVNSDSKILPSEPSTSKATCYKLKSQPQPRKPPVRKNKNISEVNSDSRISPSEPSTIKATCYKLNSQRQPRKPPVWKNGNNDQSWNNISRRNSRRLSLIKNKDVYELEFSEGSFENKPKKKIIRKRRPIKLEKKKKFKAGLTATMLTTDPLFGKVFPSTRELPIESATNYDSCNDDDGYEASISMENETEVSVFSNSPAVFPVSCHISKFYGTTSTPRVATEIRNRPLSLNSQLTVQEEAKICFGFDESPQDSSLNFSPVTRAGAPFLQKHSEIDIRMTTNVCPGPTRFSPLYKNRVALAAIGNITAFRHANQVLKDSAPSKNQVSPLVLPKINSKSSKVGANNLLNKHAISIPPCHRSTRISNTANKSDTPELLSSAEVTLFLENGEDITGKELMKENEHLPRNIVSCMKNNLDVPLLEQTFTKPPRRSYTRDSLQTIKRVTLDLMDGGAPSADEDEDTEYNKLPAKKTRKSPLKRCRKVFKQPTKPRNDFSASSSTDDSQDNKIFFKKKRKNKNTLEADRWVSKMNSDFSEVEDFQLVVE